MLYALPVADDIVNQRWLFSGFPGDIFGTLVGFSNGKSGPKPKSLKNTSWVASWNWLHIIWYGKNLPLVTQKWVVVQCPGSCSEQITQWQNKKCFTSLCMDHAWSSIQGFNLQDVICHKNGFPGNVRHIPLWRFWLHITEQMRKVYTVAVRSYSAARQPTLSWMKRRTTVNRISSLEGAYGPYSLDSQNRSQFSNFHMGVLGPCYAFDN